MADKIDYSGFQLEIDVVSFLTFNQPKINIFSTAVLNDFVKAFEKLNSAECVKVLVIKSSGKHFLAGANIKEMFEYSDEDAKRFSKLFHSAMNLVENFPKPAIAAVNGFALGGGCELILACDMVIASETAVFGQPEINLGILPGAGGTQRLSKRVGGIKAKELILTGRYVKADEALNIGLINRVVPDDKLMEETMELANDIASRPLYCIETAKDLIDNGSMENEIEEFSKMFLRGERKILMEKFVNK